MKRKTYWFEFPIFTGSAQKLFIRAQKQEGTGMTDEEIRAATRAIAAEKFPVIDPGFENGGKLVAIMREEQPAAVFRHDHYPGLVIWRSDRTITYPRTDRAAPSE